MTDSFEPEVWPSSLAHAREQIIAGRADNERLREALQKIADLNDSEADEPLDDAIAIARAALEPKP